MFGIVGLLDFGITLMISKRAVAKNTPHLFHEKTPPQILGQKFDQNFGQVFDQGFWDPNIHCTGLLGRRNTVYRPTGSKKSRTL